MRMVDLIEKKKRGGTLTEEEIRWMISEFTEGRIPDYQMSAMLMAICFQGMTETETAQLTLAMRDSGDVMDLSGIPGVKVDKHSTGGVGDKTTLIVAPIVAACGGKVAKMSGRGLGHTGGTIDKLESIPGFRTSLTREEFFRAVNECGLAVIGQTGNLVPADKKLYALRDVTATVDSIPLIASSIMSKKLAAGSDAILLDVKTGSGAFMKTEAEARTLAETMVRIGDHAGRRTEAVITNMDVPLGRAVGNALEVREAIATLKGEGPKDLTKVCVTLASRMLVLSGLAEEGQAESMAERALKNGTAAERFAAMIRAQGGDPGVVSDVTKLPAARCTGTITAAESGWISHMDAEGIGTASMLLGAGRATKEDVLDYGAGILLVKKTGEKVMAGDTLAILYTSDKERLPAAEEKFRESIRISDKEPDRPVLIYGIVR